MGNITCRNCLRIKKMLSNWRMLLLAMKKVHYIRRRVSAGRDALRHAGAGDGGDDD
jgi:hypothetical protein